jgi:hypothetical protein
MVFHAHVPSGGWTIVPFVAAVQRRNLIPSTWSSTLTFLRKIREFDWEIFFVMKHGAFYRREYTFLIASRRIWKARVRENHHYHDDVAIKQLGHLLTPSVLTHSEVPSIVFLGSFCLLGCSFLSVCVTCYVAIDFNVVSILSCKILPAFVSWYSVGKYRRLINRSNNLCGILIAFGL